MCSVLYIVVCRLVLFRFAIALSVILRFKHLITHLVSLSFSYLLKSRKGYLLCGQYLYIGFG